MNGQTGLLSKLERLKRNEPQMTEAQKIQYKPELDTLKRQIRSGALAFGRDFIFLGVQVEENDLFAMERIRSVLSENEMADAERAALAVLFECYDFDAYLLELMPVYLKLYYLGYGPYWAKHCKKIKDSDDVAQFSHYNDLIGMYWVPEWHEWKTKGKWEVTVKLPPTMKEIKEEYRREVERYGTKKPTIRRRAANAAGQGAEKETPDSIGKTGGSTKGRDL